MTDRAGRIAALRAILHEAVDLACDLLDEAPTQERTAEDAPPSSLIPEAPHPPSPRASGRTRRPKTAASIRAARHYFEARERTWKAVPAGVTWEAWLASPEGVAWQTGGVADVAKVVASVAATTATAPSQHLATPRNGVRNTSQRGSQHLATPPHTPPSGENSGEFREEEEVRTRGEKLATLATNVAATTATAPSQHLATLASSALEVLSQASKGRVSILASAKDQTAFALALTDVGLRGIADLEAFGRALAGDGASKLWPRSEAAKARGALTVGFFLGRDANARMLADGVTRWRETQVSPGPRGDASPGPAKNARPEVPEMSEAEKGRRAREAFTWLKPRPPAVPTAPTDGGGVPCTT